MFHQQCEFPGGFPLRSIRNGIFKIPLHVLGAVQFCYSKFKIHVPRDMLTRRHAVTLYVAFCDLPNLKSSVFLMKEGLCGSEVRLSPVSCFSVSSFLRQRPLRRLHFLVQIFG